MMIGQAVGRYQILEELGRGGMGIVYKALDTTLNRPVAIKVIAPARAGDRRAEDRFKREALAAARIDHPYVCKVYEIFDHEGSSCIVLEYVEGQPLSSYCSDPAKSLPLDRTLDVCIEIAEALKEAHARNIVHRDIKPANVMLLATGHVKVLDFGLAKPLENHDTSRTCSESLTAEGVFVGTPSHMAPEQIKGADVDARSDIFSFGILLFELLSGRNPFAAPTVSEITAAILVTDPQPLSRYNSRVPESLDRIVRKMLAKDPSERYQSVDEVGAELRRLRQEITSQASPEQAVLVAGRDASRRARKLLLSRRSMLAFLSLVSIGTIIILILWLGAGGPALSFASRNWILICDFDNQTGDPLFDKSLATAFAVSMEQSTHANVFPRARMDPVLRRMGSAGQRIDEKIGREICIRERVRGLIVPAISKVGSRYALSARLVDPTKGEAVRSYLENADGQDAILPALGKVAAEIRKDLGESLSSIQLSNRNLSKVTTPSLEALNTYTDATILWSKGQYREAEQLMLRALELDHDFAMAHAALGIYYYSHIFSDGVKGKEHFERALKLLDRTTDRERRLIELQYEGAMGHFERAKTLYEIYLKSYPDDSGIRYNYGNDLRDDGQLEEAIKQYQDVLRIAPNHASSLINIATSYALLGKPAEALQFYNRAFEIEPTWITNFNLNHEYGFTLIAAGDPAKARQVFAQGLATSIKSMALRSIALLDLYEGKYGSAKARLEEAILLNKSSQSALNEARNHLFLAVLLQGQGDMAGHLRELDRSAQCLQKAGPQPWLNSRLGIGYARAHVLGKAKQILKAVGKEIDVNNPQQNSNLHRLEGEIELAQRHFGRALELLLIADREHTDALSLESLARAYRLSGDADKAIVTCELFLSKAKSLGWEPQQDWIEAHYNLATLYLSRNEVEKAQKMLQTVISLWTQADPDLPLLRATQRLNDEITHRLRAY